MSMTQPPAPAIGMVVVYSRVGGARRDALVTTVTPGATWFEIVGAGTLQRVYGSLEEYQDEEPCWTAASSPATDPVGRTAAPSHYVQQPRETIDRQRDRALQLAREYLLTLPADKRACLRDYIGLTETALADIIFGGHCTLTAMKYTDRALHKGAREQDDAKATWYAQMARHVRDPDDYADPRADRADHVSYDYCDADVAAVHSDAE